MAIRPVRNGYNHSSVGTSGSSPEKSSVEGVARGALRKRLIDREEEGSSASSPLRLRVETAPGTPTTVERAPVTLAGSFGSLRIHPEHDAEIVLLRAAKKQGLLTDGELDRYCAVKEIDRFKRSGEDQSFIDGINNKIIDDFRMPDGIAMRVHFADQGPDNDRGGSTVSSAGLWDE